MKTNKFAGIASAAAMLVVAGTAYAAERPAGATGAAISANDTVHCYGVNSCKGTADCKNAAHECKGHNDCKAQGFKAKTAKACIAAKGGVIGDLN